jgi:hypothetical protein
LERESSAADGSRSASLQSLPRQILKVSRARQENYLKCKLMCEDTIVVQSMDGALSVFEQGRIAIASCLLPNFLLPGPMIYLPDQECIVTFSSTMQLEAYRCMIV